MSYGIVRVQKFKASGVTGIQIHDHREKDKSHTNKDIDWTKTEQNYDFAPQDDLTFKKRIKKRIDQLDLKRAVRKDAVTMVQCLVTSDRDFFDRLSPEETHKFFKDSYDFLADRYGSENIVSSVVHMDEKTPHMHFNFVPVTDDGRLSGKSVINRMSIIKLHDEFAKTVGTKYNLERGERRDSDEPPKKHLEVAEFKKQTERELKSLETKLSEYQNIKSNILDIEKIDLKKGLFTDNVTLSKSDAEKLKKNAVAKAALEFKVNQLEKDLFVKSEDEAFYKSTLKSRGKSNIELKSQIKGLEQKYEDLQDYLRCLGLKPNMELFSAFNKVIQNEDWTKVSMHLKRMNLSKEPLSGGILNQYASNYVDWMIKNSKKKITVTENDLQAIKSKVLESLEILFKDSLEFNYNAESDHYEPIEHPRDFSMGLER